MIDKLLDRKSEVKPSRARPAAEGPLSESHRTARRWRSTFIRLAAETVAGFFRRTQEEFSLVSVAKRAGVTPAGRMKSPRFVGGLDQACESRR